MSYIDSLKLIVPGDYVHTLLLALQDKRLSWEAKGIYMHLNEKFRGGETISFDYILDQQPDQDPRMIAHTLQSIRSLAKYGYAICTRKTDEAQ